MSNGAHPLLIGRTLGNRYVVERVLGTGAMGTVYCARQMGLGALVAIKVLHPRLTTDPSLVQRFEREAFATSRLDHPNALRVLDFGQDGDLFYLVTEYVEAGDLLSLMAAEWPLSDERIVEILSQVLSALVAVHEVGIVHRDLKPENILVLVDKNDDGANVDVVKVCDFGIAKVARQMLPRSGSFSPRLTEEGVVMGTPDYMSPEQAQGRPVDGRSDLYSVGVVLYHLLAGQTPFTADSPVGIALQHVSEAPVPPSQHRNVHPGLQAVCMRALNKRPDDRFQTAGEMRKALRDALTKNSALALVSAPVKELQVGSTFSTSRPAVLSLKDEIARHRSREDQRRRRRSVLAYAAAASVTLTASAFVASRSSSTVDPVERAYQYHGYESPESSGRVHAGIAPISPERATALSAATQTTNDGEPPTFLGLVTAVNEAADARLPKIEPPKVEPPAQVEPTRRDTSRGRQQPAPKQAQRSVIALSPPASPIPAVASADALLIRSEPWTRPPDAPESPPSVAVQRPAPAPREASEPRAAAVSEPAPPLQNVQAPPSRSPIASVSLDTARASVGFIGVVTGAGISGAKVKVALSHLPLLTCYQQALRSRPTNAQLDTQLRLTIDLGGRVVGATLSRDGDLPGLRGCIEAAARGARIQGVDTGDGSATVQLRFSPR